MVHFTGCMSVDTHLELIVLTCVCSHEELPQIRFNMPDGKGSDIEMESENEEDGVVSYKQKYRQLKSRLKCLVYVSTGPAERQIGRGADKTVHPHTVRSTSVLRMTFRRPRPNSCSSPETRGECVPPHSWHQPSHCQCGLLCCCKWRHCYYPHPSPCLLCPRFPFSSLSSLPPLPSSSLPPSFLLDQLMRYEAVVLSGEEEETDYSSGEEEALLQSANTPPTSEPVVGHQHGLACAENSESLFGFLLHNTYSRGQWNMHQRPERSE